MNTEELFFSEFPPFSVDRWKELVLSTGKVDPNWATPEGFSLDPIYWPTEGNSEYPLMVPAVCLTGGTFALRQDIEIVDLETSRRRALDAISGGCDTIGFRVSSKSPDINLHSLSVLLDGLPLDSVPIHFMAAPSFSGMLVRFMNTRVSQEAPLHGSFLFDPFVSSLKAGRAPDAAYFASAADLLHSLDQLAPDYLCLGIDGAFYAEAGANLTWQIAAILATASDYLASLSDLKIPASRIMERMHIRFSSGVSYFFDIAAPRVIRSLLRKVYAAYLSGDTPVPEPFLHVETSRFHATACEPTTNLLRHTTEAAAAIIGGCDSLSVNPHEPGSEHDATLRYARNLGLVLRHEASLDRVCDPSRGAYYFEHLTDQLAGSAWSAFQSIENDGGLAAAIRSEFLQRSIRGCRAMTDERIRSGRQTIIGTNRYPDPGKDCSFSDETIPTPGPAAPGESAMDKLFDRLLDASARGASLTELGALWDSPGAEPCLPLHPYRGAEAFEEIRRDLVTYRNRVNRAGDAMMVSVGSTVHRTASDNYVMDFLGCAGIRTSERHAFESMDEAARKEFSLSGAAIFVLCAPAAILTNACLNAYRDQRLAADGILMIHATDSRHEPTTAMREVFDHFIHPGVRFFETLRAIVDDLIDRR